MSNPGEPEEPWVETLRAEVRVLMVSSGQVSLSTARQLDTVEPRAIKPFGRVRIDEDPTGQMIEVIGSVDGVLARSATSRKLFKCSRGGLGAEQCAEYKRLLRADAAALKALDDQARQAGLTPPLPVPGSTPTSQALIDHLDHEWWGYTGEKALYQAWGKLPLIVLAG